MEIKITKDGISRTELKNIAKNQFGNLVKIVVDTNKEIIAAGGELHSDEEALLLQKGSEQKDLWGINIYPDKSEKDFIEFDSMINVRPSQDNNSRGVESVEIRQKIKDIMSKLVV